jgi:YebC/PmpR family DNA-binding regulatory protein
MSGHNKWSKIKHKKAASDAAKGKLFSKYSTLITMEVRRAGGNADAAAVQTAIERARKEAMPKENIERAIAKGQGVGGASLEAVMFEGYGPGGVALIIEAVTDNINRTAPELKHLFTKAGYAIGVPGSALWAFRKTDTGYTPITPIEIDERTAEALSDFVTTLEAHDDVTEVFTSADSEQTV